MAAWSPVLVGTTQVVLALQPLHAAEMAGSVAMPGDMVIMRAWRDVTRLGIGREKRSAEDEHECGEQGLH